MLLRARTVLDAYVELTERHESEIAALDKCIYHPNRPSFTLRHPVQGALALIRSFLSFLVGQRPIVEEIRHMLEAIVEAYPETAEPDLPADEDNGSRVRLPPFLWPDGVHSPANANLLIRLAERNACRSLWSALICRRRIVSFGLQDPTRSSYYDRRRRKVCVQIAPPPSSPQTEGRRGLRECRRVDGADREKIDYTRCGCNSYE